MAYYIVHPNILPVLEIVKLKNQTLFIMPKLPRSLHDAISTREFQEDKSSLNKSKYWFRGILAGLDHLHKIGLCHMDLKSDNILIDRKESAVICDFSGLNYTKDPVNR